MHTTRYTDLVGSTVPIQRAGMGRLAFPPLAVAVAEASGLGQVSIGELAAPSKVAQVLDETRRQTTGAIGVNLLGPDAQSDDDLEIIKAASSHVRVEDHLAQSMVCGQPTSLCYRAASLRTAVSGRLCASCLWAHRLSPGESA